jgi:hypothetical protein
MTEFISAIGVLWCSITYWAGGQELPFFNRGFKWIRRYAMPLGLCAVLIWLGAIWWKAVLACLGLSAATHIGYQDKWYKFTLTGLAMGAPAFILSFPDFNWLVGLPCSYHTAYGLISLKNNRFQWAWVALLMGTGIGIAYISSIK